MTTLREHLGSASMHAAVLMQNLVEDSNDWYQASEAHAHIEAALARLEGAEERFRPPSWKTSDEPQERLRLVPDPEVSA